MRFILISYMFLFCSSNFATEIDSFTDRDPAMKDSTFAINRIINNYFQKAMGEANGYNSCAKSRIVTALNRYFRGLLWSEIENEITEGKTVDKRRSPVNQSIYQDFNAFESPTLAIAQLGAVFRIGEDYIGSDKITHVFQLGYDLFEKMYIKHKPWKEVMEYNDWTEATYLGLWTTGVYSYGDLAANYDGIKFWERVTNLGLSAEESPYFECVDNQWHQVVPFDIRDYANAAWDEGNNCNGYYTPTMEKKVEARIADLEAKTGRKLQCPIQPELCETMIARYGNDAKHIITPKCF